MNNLIIRNTSFLFDRAHRYWGSDRFMKVSGSILVIVYLVFLALIGLKQIDQLKDVLHIIPGNFFKAIEFAFTLLLFFEVISLVFSLPESISKSVSIQLEIFSLILLRNAFKIFGEFQGAITWEMIEQNMYVIFANGFGSLIIFLLLMYIRKIERHLPICRSDISLSNFVRVKKFIAIVLLVVFMIMISVDIVFFFIDIEVFNFFHNFYTILIFTDILIVFISLRYSNNYYVIFRNSGYAVATVLIRIALELPSYYMMLVGLAATVLVFALVVVYNKAYQLEDDKLLNIELK
jgi:hypothetical protein